MASNLPPGVTESIILGNRPEDDILEGWIDGDIGEVLLALASFAWWEGQDGVGEHVRDALWTVHANLRNNPEPGDPVRPNPDETEGSLADDIKSEWTDE
jgi:hypothetical protein